MRNAELWNKFYPCRCGEVEKKMSGRLKSLWHGMGESWRSLRGLAILHPLRTFAVFTLFMVIVFGLYFYVLRATYTDASERGQFGDMFGGLNAFVSALAFGGLVIAILLQQQQIKEGRHFAKMAQVPFVTLNRPQMWCGIFPNREPTMGGVTLQFPFVNATEYPALDMIVIIRVRNSNGSMGDIAKYYVASVTKGGDDTYVTKLDMGFDQFRTWVSYLKNLGSIFEVVYLYRSLFDVGILIKDQYTLRFTNLPNGYLECLFNGKSYDEVNSTLKQKGWQTLKVEFERILGSSEHRVLSIDKFLSISRKYRPSLVGLDDPNIV